VVNTNFAGKKFEFNLSDTVTTDKGSVNDW